MRPFELDRIEPRLCLFEFVYFARPDAQLYGRSVHQARIHMGEQLAEQAPVEADMVMGVPESATPAAEGYARRSGIPYGQGLVKNRYIGRTFIAPSQELRSRGVRMKLNPLRENIAGKRLVVVDDSIVRGTTTRAIVAMLRESGAAEVHLRISSPPYRWPCFYGMDTGERGELLAANLTVDEIRDYVGADTLAYLDLDRLVDRDWRGRRRLLHRLPHGELPGARAGDAVEERARGPGACVDAGLMGSLDYRSAGVDIDAGEEAVRRIKPHVASTTRPEVIGGIGGFGALFALEPGKYDDPVLVSSTDGVGTKAMIATATGRYDTIGIDLVAMCVDDIACQGAEPLWFLDYISVGQSRP